MSDWTWEYVPDAANVVGGLTEAQVEQVENPAARIADAVAVRRIGTAAPASACDVHHLVHQRDGWRLLSSHAPPTTRAG